MKRLCDDCVNKGCAMEDSPISTVTWNGITVTCLSYEKDCLEEVNSEDFTEMKGNVIKPNHYNAGKFDVIEFCLENEIDFCRGNVIKYVVRAGKKDIHKEIEDLNKAKEYIDRIIKHIENKGE